MPESKLISLKLNPFSERCKCLCMCVWRGRGYVCMNLTVCSSGQILCQLLRFLLKLCEVVGSLFCVLAALCFQFVLFCVFLSFFLCYFSRLSPHSCPMQTQVTSTSSFTLLCSPLLSTYLQRSQVSVWFGTLTSLYCFSSFSFKAKNLSFPTSSPFLISNN